MPCGASLSGTINFALCEFKKNIEILQFDALYVVLLILFYSIVMEIISFDRSVIFISGNTMIAEYKKLLVGEHTSSHKQKCFDKPIQCPTCNSVIALRVRFDHVCEAMAIKGMSFIIFT